MIRKSSLAIGELIAAGGGTLVPGPVVQGLNEVSVNGFQLTPDIFREQVLDATEHNAHSDILEASSTRLAEIIRETQETIRTQGTPLAQLIAKDTSILYSPKMLSDRACGRFSVQFVNVDDKFFDSSLFPTSPSDTTLSYSAVGLGQLERLTFDYPSDADIKAFVATNHPEVCAVLDNPECSLSYAVSTINERYDLRETFKSDDKWTFDFSAIKSVDIARLLKAYVVLTKMRSCDDPVPWLKAGSLADYREYVNLLFHGFTVYLLNLKKLILAYRAQRLVIQQKEPVVLKSGDRGVFENVPFLVGDLKVYYTDELLEKITAGNHSFQEVLMGMYYGRLTGQNVTVSDFINDVAPSAMHARNYFANCAAKLTEESRVVFRKGALEAIVKFSSDPIRRERIEKQLESGQSLHDWVYKNFSDELNTVYAIVSERCGTNGPDVAGSDSVEGVGIDDRTAAILSTNLVVRYLRAIGCTMAADLIAATFVMAEEDNVRSQRERLHVAMIELIVSRLLE